MASLRKPILAANWKMNLGPTAASGFFESFLSRYALRADRTVIVFPSAIALSAARHAAQARPDIQLGVQNVHTAEKGAFTGETSVSMAHDAGAHFVLVGHSLMCIDSPTKHGFTFTPSMSVFVNCESVAELEHAFERLADGGQVLMPLAAYGFSARFGWVNDRFGVSWQLNLA